MADLSNKFTVEKKERDDCFQESSWEALEDLPLHVRECDQIIAEDDELKVNMFVCNKTPLQVKYLDVHKKRESREN